jgi:putative hydrolase of the HAD superfamily
MSQYLTWSNRVTSLRFSAIVFDFFGTLTRAYQRGPGHEEIARILGVSPLRFMGALNRTFPARARGEYGGTEASLRRLAQEVGADPSPAQVAAAAALRVSTIRSEIRMRPGAITALALLRTRGIRTAVVTDCTSELPEVWASLPIAPLIDTAVFSVQIGACKPDPVMFSTAARRLDVHPGDCLYIGDGGGRELSGAGGIGMTAVQLLAEDRRLHLTFDPEPAWTGPHITHLVDVLDLIEHTRGGPAATGPYWTDERAGDRLLKAATGQPRAGDRLG